jgi:hypothetical protein
MKQALILATFMFAGLTACAVDPDPNSLDSAEPASAAEPVSRATAEAASSVIGPGCYASWECDWICGTYIGGVLHRYPTNVLHQYCPDGSDTVIVRHACGEDCY